jgi:hypothetical protein
MEDLSTETARRRAIAWATALAANTALEPQGYERALLECYAVGELSLTQVLQRLDRRVQHVLYRSQATQTFSERQLEELLAESRAWNQAHGITGLLCYSDQHFVQLLEGPPDEVDALYARIQRDPRHSQVTTLHMRADAQRFFADWQMGFVTVEAGEFEWVLTSLERPRAGSDVARHYVRDPALLLLLDAFSRA